MYSQCNHRRPHKAIVGKLISLHVKKAIKCIARTLPFGVKACPPLHFHFFLIVCFCHTRARVASVCFGNFDEKPVQCMFSPLMGSSDCNRVASLCDLWESFTRVLQRRGRCAMRAMCANTFAVFVVDLLRHLLDTRDERNATLPQQVG